MALKRKLQSSADEVDDSLNSLNVRASVTSSHEPTSKRARLHDSYISTLPTQRVAEDDNTLGIFVSSHSEIGSTNKNIVGAGAFSAKDFKTMLEAVTHWKPDRVTPVSTGF